MEVSGCMGEDKRGACSSASDAVRRFTSSTPCCPCPPKQIVKQLHSHHISSEAGSHVRRRDVCRVCLHSRSTHSYLVALLSRGNNSIEWPRYGYGVHRSHAKTSNGDLSFPEPQR